MYEKQSSGNIIRPVPSHGIYIFHDDRLTVVTSGWVKSDILRWPVSCRTRRGKTATQKKGEKCEGHVYIHTLETSMTGGAGKTSGEGARTTGAAGGGGGWVGSAATASFLAGDPPRLPAPDFALFVAGLSTLSASLILPLAPPNPAEEGAGGAAISTSGSEKNLRLRMRGISSVSRRGEPGGAPSVSPR